ncbi:MAG TPA: hypothetical protein PLP33_19735 [Leptospiraceae bacterium]|nr:hypothetical protein [Leptospiraceae bacterium]
MDLKSIRSQFAAFVGKSNTARMYTESNNRNVGASDSTRRNPAWLALRCAKVGDVLYIERREIPIVGAKSNNTGTRGFYKVTNIVTEHRNTHVILQRIDDATKVMNFSWRNLDSLRIETIRPASNAEVAAIEAAKAPAVEPTSKPSPAAKKPARKPSKPRAKATAKVVAKGKPNRKTRDSFVDAIVREGRKGMSAIVARALR